MAFYTKNTNESMIIHQHQASSSSMHHKTRAFPSQPVDDTGHTKTSEGPLKPVKPADMHILTFLYYTPPFRSRHATAQHWTQNTARNHWVNRETCGYVQFISVYHYLGESVYPLSFVCQSRATFWSGNTFPSRKHPRTPPAVTAV